MENTCLYTTGSHVIIRDAEWRIQRAERSEDFSWCLYCVGISDFVKGREARFLVSYEDKGGADIKVLRPEDTRLVEDRSPGFINSKLYLEAVLRSAPKNDNGKLYGGMDAVMDCMPYQFDPAIMALAQPRVRILIADAVGIGKTLEAGILTTELILRGRGRRILVLATSAMLRQFQQEFWNRFSIPLVRLDSNGIQRVRTKIPPNHNPFLYFDRSIISLDTLKQREYLAYLESAYWDLIIIDEAHNVALRGERSQRSRLAELLSKRSDSLIMLTATPHDGKPESFASLLNMLDATAIVAPEHYTPDDYVPKGLVIRRFKANVKDQVNKDFPERRIELTEAVASAAENSCYALIEALTEHYLSDGGSAGGSLHLFSTTLIKALFSSPSACLAVTEHRLSKLKKKLAAGDEDAEGIDTEIALLEDLKGQLECMGTADFAKLRVLIKLLKSPAYGWQHTDPHDRVVIFTEYLETQRFLCEVLPGLLGLKAELFGSLNGVMKDTEVQDKVEEFNKERSPLRMLICSDMASEGINLHHFSHRLIHFDLPWSLMTFQQRNGRVDRYGQTQRPLINYLQTISAHERIKGDAKILERLQHKDEQAQINMADPGEFSLSREEQEERTYALMEGSADGTADGSADSTDLFDLFGLNDESSTQDEGNETSEFALNRVMSQEEYQKRLNKPQTLFGSRYDFACACLKELFRGRKDRTAHELELDERDIKVPLTDDLRARLRYLPSEILSEEGQSARFVLTPDKQLAAQELEHLRLTEQSWPSFHYLSELHPVMQYLTDSALSTFGRHAAPVLQLDKLQQGEYWYLLQGGYPNRRGFTPVHAFVAVHKAPDGTQKTCSTEELFAALGLDKPLSNRVIKTAEGSDESFAELCAAKAQILKAGLGAAVELTQGQLQRLKEAFVQRGREPHEARLQELTALQERHLKEYEKELARGNFKAETRARRLEERKQRLDAIFQDAKSYLEDVYKLENEPYLQLLAVFTAEAW
ncbi:MAG: DEAD/DEAH box helicase [Succinivibrio sp.]|nr:DEAD/DEAH box helicase [Succinivibrio sp.]